MNTTKVGDKFENKVFDLFSNELREGRLLFRPENSKIFKKKGYYSRDRDKDIEFDVSIEAYLPGESDWSILTVIECKNYSNRVPVDDIEEFNSKLQQVAGKNVKGIVISSNAFQESALKYAKARGIGLIRLTHETDFKWILNRSATSLATEHTSDNRKNIRNGLTNPHFSNEYLDFYSTIGTTFTHSANKFLEVLLKRDSDPDEISFIDSFIRKSPETDRIVPYLEKEEIESKSLEILELHQNDSVMSPIEKICSELNDNGSLEIKFVDDLGADSTGFEILGKVQFDPDKIFIKKGQENYHRKRFTIAHELGHYFLNHEKYLEGEFYSQKDEEENYLNSINSLDIKRLEWQANYFASCLLLPREQFLKEFFKLYEKENLVDKSFGILYVDNQSCNLDTFYRLTNQLRSMFQVSRQVIEIRLKEENIMVDERSLI